MEKAKQTVLVVGGSSDIAKATVLAFAAAGWDAVICGRDLEAMQAEAVNLQLRCHGCAVSAGKLDILNVDGFDSFLDSLPVLPDVVVSAVGLLGDQSLAERDPDHAASIMRTNYEGPSLFLGLVAARFEERGSGTIVGISSVAGDRGRSSNYAYGSAKAGFSAFLSGLRNRLAGKGVHVVSVKPGFVRTRMTAGMELPGALTAEPGEVGQAILAAVRKRKDVVYVRRIWWLVMAIIKSIPERIFKRTSI